MARHPLPYYSRKLRLSIPLRRLDLTIRHNHSLLAPFSEPDTYEILAKRLSNFPTLYHRYSLKRQMEKKEQGIMVDIHDIGLMDLNNYDMLIPDISQETLASEVSELLGIT